MHMMIVCVYVILLKFCQNFQPGRREKSDMPIYHYKVLLFPYFDLKCKFIEKAKGEERTIYHYKILLSHSRYIS